MSRNMEDFIPRKTELYEWTDHFETRLDDDQRPLSEDMINPTVRNGGLLASKDLNDGGGPGGGGWIFAKEYDGIRVMIICAVNPDLDPAFITTLGEVEDKHAAYDSGRYRNGAVDAIMLRSTLHDHHADESDIVPIGCTREPARVKGHRLISVAGKDHASCMDCDAQGYDIEPFSRDNCSPNGN